MAGCGGRLAGRLRARDQGREHRLPRRRYRSRGRPGTGHCPAAAHRRHHRPRTPSSTARDANERFRAGRGHRLRTAGADRRCRTAGRRAGPLGTSGRPGAQQGRPGLIGRGRTGPRAHARPPHRRGAQRGARPARRHHRGRARPSGTGRADQGGPHRPEASGHLPVPPEQPGRRRPGRRPGTCRAATRATGVGCGRGERNGPLRLLIELVRLRDEPEAAEQLVATQQRLTTVHPPTRWPPSCTTRSSRPGPLLSRRPPRSHPPRRTRPMTPPRRPTATRPPPRRRPSRRRVGRPATRPIVAPQRARRTPVRPSAPLRRETPRPAPPRSPPRPPPPPPPRPVRQPTPAPGRSPTPRRVRPQSRPPQWGPPSRRRHKPTGHLAVRRPVRPRTPRRVQRTRPPRWRVSSPRSASVSPHTSRPRQADRPPSRLPCGWPRWRPPCAGAPTPPRSPSSTRCAARRPRREPKATVCRCSFSLSWCAPPWSPGNRWSARN